MHKARIFAPEGIDSDLMSTVKNHLADKYGGYTVLTGSGAWKNPETGQKVTEEVNILEIIGMKEGQAQSTAKWLADKSQESEVLWTHQEINGGFQKGAWE